jgi:CRP-like cAMP-binding protein
MMDFVQQNPYFKQWSKNQLRKLMLYTELIPVNRGEVIIKQGEKITTTYMIRKGQFEVKKRLCDTKDDELIREV